MVAEFQNSGIDDKIKELKLDQHERNYNSYSDLRIFLSFPKNQALRNGKKKKRKTRYQGLAKKALNFRKLAGSSRKMNRFLTTAYTKRCKTQPRPVWQEPVGYVLIFQGKYFVNSGDEKKFIFIWTKKHRLSTEFAPLGATPWR